MVTEAGDRAVWRGHSAGVVFFTQQVQPALVNATALLSLHHLLPILPKSGTQGQPESMRTHGCSPHRLPFRAGVYGEGLGGGLAGEEKGMQRSLPRLMTLDSYAFSLNVVVCFYVRLEGWGRVCDVQGGSQNPWQVLGRCVGWPSRVCVIFSTDSPQLWDFIAISNYWQSPIQHPDSDINEEKLLLMTHLGEDIGLVEPGAYTVLQKLFKKRIQQYEYKFMYERDH